MNKLFKTHQRIALTLVTSAALFGSLSLSSCRDYDTMDEQVANEVAKVQEFTKNFEDRYGKIDPNHTWGFGNLEAVNYSISTRATTDTEVSGAGNVNVQLNMWTEVDNNGYKGGALARTVAIPGWPNFDGYYYTATSSNGYGSIVTEQPTSMDNCHAAGDVTDYEIQYVSQWFREHKNPTSISLHLTDFFVQNISADNDRTYYPDGTLITEVLGQNCTFQMDHIIFAGIESTSYSSGIDNTWTHLNNYNSGNTNKMHYFTPEKTMAQDIDADGNPVVDENGNPVMHDVFVTKANDGIISDGWNNSTSWYSNDQLHNREIKYVTSSGTEDFAYTESFGLAEGAQGTYHNDWVLVHLEWNEIGKDGVSHNRDGYYLAFDYSTQKDGVHYDRDGYYSNWIVKITPAYDSHQPNSPRRRIMCEDLGNTWDFDFNDVVFDVYFESVGDDATDAVITLQASGGTLPIFVGKSPTDASGAYEAHKMLGQSSSSIPVNVDANPGATHEIAIYRLRVTDTNPNNIPVYVQSTSNGATNTITLLPSGKGSGQSKVPQKFSVPTSVRWTKESQQIEWAYELFDDWVNNASGYDDTPVNDYYSNPPSITYWYAPTGNYAGKLQTQYLY